MNTKPINYCECAPQPATRQLQFFDFQSKRYAPSAHQGTLDPDDARMAAAGRPWRIAKAERDLKPKFAKRPVTAGGLSVYDANVRCGQYLKWAKDKGLTTVTNWKHKGLCPGFQFTRLVDKDLYFAVTIEDCA